MQNLYVFFKRFFSQNEQIFVNIIIEKEQRQRKILGRDDIFLLIKLLLQQITVAPNSPCCAASLSLAICIIYYLTHFSRGAR